MGSTAITAASIQHFIINTLTTMIETEQQLAKDLSLRDCDIILRKFWLVGNNLLW